MSKLAAVALLPLLAAAALAQSTLQRLKLDAGENAVELSLQTPAIERTIEVLEPRLTPATLERIQSAFRRAEAAGFAGITWGGMPLGVRFVSVPLRLMTCPSCASYSALVPYGVVAPGAPTRDPNAATYIILSRSVGRFRPVYSSPIALAKADVLDSCSGLEMTARPWALGEAVRATQACLDKTYFQDRFARRAYFVTARAGKVSINTCPPNARCMAGIVGPFLVDGIVIAVSGRVPSGDTVLSDLEYSLDKRGNRLLGHPASLTNEAQAQPPNGGLSEPSARVP